jgi:NADPH-dependent 2,4-dienoyl-CoA reductase/sulfur reductase-like enzyme
MKILCTLFLLSGFLLHLLSWDFVCNSLFNHTMLASVPATSAEQLSPSISSQVSRLLMLNFGGLLLIAVTSFWLLKRMPLKRKERTVTSIFIAALLLVDVVVRWVVSPACLATTSLPQAIPMLSHLGLLLVILVGLYQLWVYTRWSGNGGKPVHVAIVGGGFGGLYTALALHKQLGYHKDLEITLFDRNNYFLFPPLLPSAAAGILEIRQVSFPFRRIFETMRVNFRKMEVTGIDTEEQIVQGRIVRESSDHSVESYHVDEPYDFLVIAPGSKVATYELPGVEKYAFFLRELRDAIIIRNRVIDLFERAAGINDAQEQKNLLDFVVIGAGATGIEIATELQDLIQDVLLERYLELDPTAPKVTIVQSGPTVLPGWPEDIQKIAQKRLTDLGITVQLGQRVKEVKLDCVILNNENVLPSFTTIWCAEGFAPLI